LMVGTNNVSTKAGSQRRITSVSAFKTQYSLLLEATKDKFPNATIIIHDLLPRFLSKKWFYTLSLSNMLERIPLFNSVLQELSAQTDNVLLCSSYDECAGDVRRFICPDGLHPSDAGVHLIQQAIIQVCRSNFSTCGDSNLSNVGNYSYCPDTICRHPCHELTDVSLKAHTVEEFTSSINFDNLNKRQVQYYGDYKYGYGSCKHSPNSMWRHPLIASIATELRALRPDLPFNSVLVNYYKDGTKIIPFHRDNEREIVKNSTIISISYGAERTFLFRMVHWLGKQIHRITLKAGQD